MPVGLVPPVGAGIYGLSHPVLLNGRSRIRNSLKNSPTTTCRISRAEFEKSGTILGDPGKQVRKLAET
jgi:hypothetical protein